MLGQNIHSLSFKMIYIVSLGLKKGARPLSPSPHPKSATAAT